MAGVRRGEADGSLMFASFWLYASLPPFLVALGVTRLLRPGRRKFGRTLAEIGPVLGFLAGFVGVVRGVPFLNNVAHHRIGEGAVLALAVAFALALTGPGPRLGRYAALGAAVLALVWQAQGDDWPVVAVACLVALLILDRLVFLARIGASAMLVLALASLGLAMVAISARAGLLGGLALALAAASAGWLVWARPFGSAKPGLAAAVSGGMVFVTLAFAVAQSAARTPWSLAPLLACFWAEAILRQLPFIARWAKRKQRRPAALALSAALPVAVAMVLGTILP
jgi:hypothetical protein